MKQTAIELNKLSFRYHKNSRPVLDSIDLKINTGEFTALLGPNGAGKTTLFNIISGILPCSQNHIAIFGRDLNSLKAFERAGLIGIVPQDSASNFNFTNLEIVLMGRSSRSAYFENSREDVDYALEAMRMTGTEHLADCGFMEISGGEKQRVIIAQVIAQDTRILLLDEPTSSLDINYQIEIMQLVSKIGKEKNLTIVGVFHDMNLAAQYAERMVLLKDGRVYKDGKPEKVLTSDVIHDVYSAHVLVEKNPFTNKMYITPFHPVKKLSDGTCSHWKKVHVIAGGGAGAYLIHILHSEGHTVSTCILSSIDTDSKMAMQLNIPVVHEEPFVEISEENKKKNLELVENSDVIIVSRVPIGTGNLFNLWLVETALQQDKKVYFIDGEHFAERDFTGGEASAFYRKMIGAGALSVKNEEEAVLLLRNEFSGDHEIF